MLSLSVLRRYFAEDIWKIRVRDLPAYRRIPLKAVKILLLSARAFRQEQESIRAAALTLYTLLSIVPVTALLFGIAKGFGLDAKLETWLLGQFADQQDVMLRMVSMARRALDTVEGGVVAGAGVAFLIYSVVKVIDNIEQAFNQIWSSVRARSWGRKFTDYLSLILVGPFLILGASSLNVYVATWLNRAVDAAPFGWLAAPAVNLGLRAAPLLLLWMLFTFIYVFVPNTRVRIPSALFGGALAAFLYQMVQTLYIDLQVGVSRTNAIYGSFAALPLFIVWLHLSWRIVLLGAEVTHQHQTFDSNEREERIPALSFRAVKRLSLRLCDLACSRFLAGKPPPTAETLSIELGIPQAVLADLLARLTRTGLLAEVATGDPEEPAYQPARDPRGLTPAFIVETLESCGEDLANASFEGRQDSFGNLLQEFDRCLENHPINRPLGSRAGEQGSWASRH